MLEFLIRNVQYSALLLAPVFALGRRTRNQTIYFGLIAAGLAITSVLGAKSGAGSYHLLPFLAPLLHAYFWIRADRAGPDPDRGFARFAIAWVAATLLLSTAHLGQGIRTFRGMREGRAIVAEIRGFERARAGESMEVGVGSGFLDQRESYGYLTTFAGGPYTIAGAAIRDFQFGGIPIPPATLRYMAACGTHDWLIPKGEQPFSALNPYYDEPHPAFDDAFRQTFLEHYRKADAGRWYDLWTCGSGKSVSLAERDELRIEALAMRVHEALKAFAARVQARVVQRRDIVRDAAGLARGEQDDRSRMTQRRAPQKKRR